jgi:hypothetical protein
MRNVSYYRDGDRIIAITDESPANFKGVLFIGKMMDGDKVSEAVFTREQIATLESIDKNDIPAVWIVAFGYERPKADKPKADKPKAGKKPRQPRHVEEPREPVVVDIMFPWTPRNAPSGCLPKTIFEAVAFIGGALAFLYLQWLLAR